MIKPEISALICTHNRDNYLSKAIESLLVQKAVNFEIIVIDNASTDNTKQVINQYLDRENFRFIYEPTLGLSVARNTGAREAKGEILAYLDDDAVAGENWLQELLSAFKNNKNLVIAGGKVSLIWPENSHPPEWLSQELAGNLGYYDLGENMINIDNPNLTPRGLNYAIRKQFWQEINGFNPHLGRVGKNLLSNEELVVTEIALKLGRQVAYIPAAEVAHHVTPERLHLGWFFQRAWWQGVSECYRQQLATEADWRQVALGGERLVRGFYKSLKYFHCSRQRFDNLVYCYGQLGYLGAAFKGLLLGK